MIIMIVSECSNMSEESFRCALFARPVRRFLSGFVTPANQWRGFPKPPPLCGCRCPFACCENRSRLSPKPRTRNKPHKWATMLSCLRISAESESDSRTGRDTRTMIISLRVLNGVVVRPNWLADITVCFFLLHNNRHYM